MITSIHAEKLFDKNIIALHNKNFQQVRNREELFQSIKGHLKKIQFTASIMLNVERPLSMKKRHEVGQLIVSDFKSYFYF